MVIIKDSVDSIAADVVSRIVNKGMPADKAFEDVGYRELWIQTLEADMPDGWENMSLNAMKAAVKTGIEQAIKRGKARRGSMRNDARVAKDLVMIARELSALGMGQDIAADPDQVETLAARLLMKLGPAKSRQLRMYGLELRPTDTVEQLARAWAMVNLAQ